MSLRIVSLWSSIASSSAVLLKRLQTCFCTRPLPTNSLTALPPALNFDHTDDVISNRLRSLNLYCTEHHLQVTRRIRDIEQLILVTFLDAFQQILATPDPAAGSRPKSEYISLLVREFERLYRLQLDSLFNTLSKPVRSTQGIRPAPKAVGGRRQGRPHIFTKHQTSVLHELLQYDDKLTPAEKTFVGERLGLSKDQVNRWSDWDSELSPISDRTDYPIHPREPRVCIPVFCLQADRFELQEHGLLDPRLREWENDPSQSLDKPINSINSYQSVLDCSGSNGSITQSMRPVTPGSSLSLNSQRTYLDSLSEGCVVPSWNTSSMFDSPVPPGLSNKDETSPTVFNAPASPSTSSLLSSSSASLTLTPPSQLSPSSHDILLTPTPPLQEIPSNLTTGKDVPSPLLSDDFPDLFLFNSFDHEAIFNFYSGCTQTQHAS
ncbi:uncharacterized protein MELLADRAFT_65580 [Melampsora larici-populina 98AG31]|uniref:Homeobox domain-containing protein n=1 Tax=Melampsora larici-populina (strain 98AG31 / pathotype 3-4-7) TaxID=747676 RepID=F4RVY7_MELLP|nr:uncharacterized protein MELLADRAFT_65580 [Melampsora larici-populina 98AG31]EGG03442.1 hypothetical protein MELLADRAFT_65580 [Melampsora larici-populina 98AG31]